MAWADAEAAVEEERRRRAARRQPLLLIALVDVLVAGIGTTAAIDLRRLDTPGGTALAWTQAAVFGDCDDYLGYSVPDPSLLDQRTDDAICRDLRARTADARADSISIGLDLGEVRASVDRAAVEVTLTRDEKPVTVVLSMLHRDGKWLVVRDARVCAGIGCA